MSAPAVTRTPQEMADEAAATLTRVREADWPPAREAQWAIEWAVAEAADCGKVYDLLVNGDLDPLRVDAPDKGWWDDPERQAREYAADQYLEAAKEAARRLEQYQPKDSSKGESCEG